LRIAHDKKEGVERRLGGQKGSIVWRSVVRVDLDCSVVGVGDRSRRCGEFVGRMSGFGFGGLIDSRVFILVWGSEVALRKALSRELISKVIGQIGTRRARAEKEATRTDLPATKLLSSFNILPLLSRRQTQPNI
jgi:hypothetical protein